MKKEQVEGIIAGWFAGQGYDLGGDPAPADLCAEKNAERWFVAALGDQDEPFAYLHAFEQGMAALVELSAETDEGPPDLGLALAFGSTLRHEPGSYRRSLKKYSNSIVFTDLNIHLLLVREDESVEHLTPQEVNPFLRELNRYIAEQRAGAT